MKWILSFTVITLRDGSEPLIEIGNFVTNEHPLLTVARWNRNKEPISSRNPAELLPRARSKVIINWYAPLTHAEHTALFATGLVSQTEPNVIAPMTT
jgi:hypothetical protein